MEVVVKRLYKKDTYTIGKMYINNKYFCDTLEDVERPLASIKDKVYGETAIPCGLYRLKMTYSNKFGCMMPEICNVPFFFGIRIHNGRTAKNTEGCILVGENKKKGELINSTTIYKKFRDLLADAELKKENNTIYIM